MPNGTFNSLSVANEFVKLAKESKGELTLPRLMRLLYIAYGWYLALEEKPLTSEPIQAGQFGPYVKSVYEALKQFGSAPLPELTTLNHVKFDPAELTGAAKTILRAVWNHYGKLPEAELDNLINSADSPYSQTLAKVGEKSEPIAISVDAMRTHYASIRKLLEPV